MEEEGSVLGHGTDQLGSLFVEKGIYSTLRGRLLTVSLLIKFINVKCGLDQPTECVIIPL
jgi:hypothetical protein